MPSVYFYTRVSTKHQGLEGHVSLDAQLDACKQVFSKRFHPSIFAHHFSETVSGRVLKNQIMLSELVANLADGDVIIVHSISRFTRDAGFGIELLKSFGRRGIRIISATEGIDSITTRLAFRNKLIEANEESDVISDRVKGSVAFVKQHGGHIGSAPYGSMAVRSPTPLINGGTYRARVLERNNAEMEVVAYIVNHVDNKTELDEIVDRDHVGICNVIADKLNSDGRMRRGIAWTPQSVKAIYKKFKDDESIMDCDGGELCAICSEGHSLPGNEMVLCDHCNGGFHIKCIHIARVPKKAFFCGLACQFAGSM